MFSDHSISGSADSAAGVDALLTAMRDGDREAAAAFITRYGSRIRRRIRGKLSPTMRRIFDSQEILSTVGRRLDLYVRTGRIEAANEKQLWSLVFKMANHAVVDKARIFRRLRLVEDEDGPFARELLARLAHADRRESGIEVEIERALGLISSSIDRQILSLWLIGTPHAEIAFVVDLAPTAVRKRWQSIRATLYERLHAEER